MLCKKCGAQIPDDAAKCEFCNEIFREEAAPADTPPTEVENNEDLESTKVLDVNGTEEASDIEEQPAEDLSQRSTHEIFEENAKRRKQHTEQPVVDEKQQQLEEITSRRNQKKIKQKRNKTILIVCICVIVAAAAGAGTFYIRNGGFPNTLIATPAPSSSPIPTLAPVVTPEVSPSPSASADPEATDAPSDSNSEDGNSSSSSTSSGSSGTNWVATGSSDSSSSSSESSSSNSANKTTSTEGKTSAATNTGKYSGSVSDKISSKLVIGDKVVYDEGADRYFMTFNMDGTMYYANVSRGSTTEQINGKYITITADATNGRYDGNTVYEISSMTYYSGDYILPDSGTKLLNKSDIQKLTKDELGLARNEIYARHGRKFQMEIYQNYFEGKSWYKVNPNYDYSNDNSNLNSIELSNVSTILSVENTK